MVVGIATNVKQLCVFKVIDGYTGDIIAYLQESKKTLVKQCLLSLLLFFPLKDCNFYVPFYKKGTNFHSLCINYGRSCYF
jgi:hypothetical protein